MNRSKMRQALRMFAVLFLTLAVTVGYSVTPFVGQAYAASAKPKAITLKTTAKTVDIKGKVTVSVKAVKPSNANKAVTWKSSNKKIATVNSKGVVVGKKKGKVKITATSKVNKKVKKTITLTVKNIKAKKISLSKKSMSLLTGENEVLKATVAPTGVYAPVYWKSSNTKVAKVSKAGKVVAVGAGSATITAYTKKKTAGKAVKATCKVTVANEDRVVFVDKDYVKAAVEAKDPKTVIAEVSWGPDAPPELIPGAIHVNTDDLESNGQDLDVEYWDLRGFNNNYKELGDALAKYGITKNSELICYGWGENNSGVTRLAMAALMMGVKHVKVLEGGTAAWFDAGYEKATTAAEPKSVTSFGAPAHPEWVISTEEMLDKVKNDSNFKLVSIRSYDEFIGKNSGYAYIDKAGEPLGAVWGHDTDDGSYFADGKFVGIDKINEYLAPYNASTDNELAFYCGTGWRATIPFLICYEAGMDNMKLWDDGWYVYSGAYADSWNWPSSETEGKLPEVKDYPVQIGDPAKGAVEETTVKALEPIYNPMRGVSVKKEVVSANFEGPIANNFSIMPPKPGITNSLKFTSSDESVATVDAAGKVTVKTTEVGKSAVITATSNATKGSSPDKAGEPTQKASFTLNITGGFEDDMDAATWATYGINYDEISLADDFILDVRTAENYAKGHIVASTNVSVAAGPIADGDDVAKALDKAYTDAAGKRIVIVCNSGNSLAKRAMEYYRTHGADMSTVTYLIEGNKGIAEGEFKLNNGIVSAADIDLNKDVVVDLRPADMYNEGHIVASANIDVMTQFTDAEKAALDEQYAKVGEDGKLVLVCIRGIGLAKKAMAYYQASGADMSKITYLIGGATGLAASDYASMLGVKEVAEGDVVIDIRPEAQFANGVPVGAISSPVSNPITDPQKDALVNVYNANKDKHIVLLCVTGNMLAWNALGALQDAGADLTKVTYLIGGFNNNWKNNYQYTIGDVTVDPAAKTASIKATVNAKYADGVKAVDHLVLNNKTNDKDSPFRTPAMPLDLHTALTNLGAIPWSDSSRELKKGQRLSDVQGDNANFSHIDMAIDGIPMSQCFKYKKNGVEADPAEAFDMAFSGNKTNQSNWNTGCVSCAFSCFAGIVTNDAVAFDTANEKENYLYLNTDVLKGGEEVTITYTLK